MRKTEWDKQRYHKLKAKGMCVYCGKVPALEGRTMCAECTGKRAVIYKRHIEKYKAEGRCIICGKPAYSKSILCTGCLQKRSQRDYKRKAAKSHEEP